MSQIRPRLCSSAVALRFWGERKLRPAVERATAGEVSDATLYLLRHSHASACHLIEGFSVPEITRRLGHSAAVHFQHYAHVIDAAGGQRFPSLEAMLRAARESISCSADVPQALEGDHE